jgi:hypothetical protein
MDKSYVPQIQHQGLSSHLLANGHTLEVYSVRPKLEDQMRCAREGRLANQSAREVLTSGNLKAVGQELGPSRILTVKPFNM